MQILFFTAIAFAVPSLLYLAGRRIAPRFFRRLAYETHLWLGIVSGLILFVVCLSGTLLTFKTETIQFLEQNRYFVKVPTGTKAKTLEELIPMIEQAEDGKVVRVTIPDAPDRSWVFNIRKNEAKRSERISVKDKADTAGRPSERPSGPPSSVSSPSGRRSGMPAMHAMLGTAYLINPYSGESLGPQRSKAYMFFMMLQFLHRFLLLPIRIGQIVVGTATLIFIVLIIGGLFLWLPAKLKSLNSWLPGLKVRTGKGWNRFLYDTHNTLGFFALIPLMIMALTGPIISFSWYRDAVGKVLGEKPFAKAFEKPVFSDWTGSQQRTLAWDDFLGKADEISSRKGITQIYIPQSPKAGVQVRKTGSGFCTIAATDKIQFDAYSGNVLKSDLFDDFTFGEQISTLIFPLHNGEIFGTVSKIVYFIACLIATTLPLTGVILWINKLRSRRKSRKQKKAAMQELTVVSRHEHAPVETVTDISTSTTGVLP